MLNFDPPVAKRSRWRRILNRLVAVVRGGKRLDGFTTLVIVVVAAVLIPKIGSTFAGSITLNAGQPVEFGQGTVMTTACDESITITPTSRFSTADTAFYLGDITVSGLDYEECYDDMFTITVFDQSGSPIDICEENVEEEGFDWFTSDALQLAYRDSEDPLLESWVLISDCFFDQSPGGSVGSGTGFVFVPSYDIDSSQVSSISIESALSTTADDLNQAVELNRSNTGTINVSTTNATLEDWEGLYEEDPELWNYSNTVWFAWTATQDGNLTIDTCDSEIDTVLQAFDDDISIAADDVGGLLTCGENQNDPSEISFDVQSGTEYLIQLGGYVDGDYEESGLAQLNWSFVAGQISTTSTTSTTIEPLSCVSPDTSTSGSDTILTFVSLASCDWIVPSGVTSVRYLVVGGGGAGDQGICNVVNPRAGGGGEVLTGTTSVTGGSTVNITVGAGGTVGPKHMTYCDNSDPPLDLSTSGSPSNFDSISARGGGTPDTTYTLSNLLKNKSGDSGNGNSGGTNDFSDCGNSPGSGGGAGGPGGNNCPHNVNGTAGGIGVQSNITGATLGYGGGGGVEGWDGFAINFPVSVDGGSNGQSAARPHSGGGGVVTFPGGSGVVIVRFLTP